MNEFIEKLLNDIHKINPELAFKRQNEYHQNYANDVLNNQSQSKQLVSFLRQYQKSCDIMHVNKIDAKNFVDQYKTPISKKQ